jgi:small subunit ribosomal protein S35
MDLEMAQVTERLIDEAEISSTAHAELEQHRELREMVRLAAWEMPLLSSLAKPFEAPDVKKMPLRWRYTTYFGEAHPASRKVVVEFGVTNLGLEDKHVEKLRKLAGPRYNPEKNIVRMSCESFETQAQNKRYLADTVNTLIAEAKDGKDTFEDIPLDTRHHTFKKRLVFPNEWTLTSEKRAQLEEKRRALLLEEGKRVEENNIVSGLTAIEKARQAKLAQVEEPVMAQARQPVAKGKMGKKQMSPKGR